MIVDDERVIIGSANINDRSLLGNRDSEIAVVVDDDKKIISKMNGAVYSASAFAQSLRLRLMREYLGVNNYDDFLLEDPLSDSLYNFLKGRASSNTKTYREIFHVVPDDEMVSFSYIKQVRNGEIYPMDKKSIKERYNKYKDDIIGYIVEYPIDFLRKQTISRSYLCKEFLVPIKSFL